MTDTRDREQKTAVQARLLRVRILEDVLPTAGVETRGARFPQLVARIRSGEAMLNAYAAELRMLPEAVAPEPAAELLDSEPLQDQMAGFAEAGLLFFRAPSLAAAPLEERRALGGNGTVTRVLLENDRLLLETPRLAVRFTAEIDEQRRSSLLGAVDAIAIRDLPFLGNGCLAAVLRGSAMEASRELMEQDDVLFAEPDFIEHVGQRYRPNDPDLGRQWHLAVTEAEAAWNTTRGQGARIVVIDNEFDTSHRDLRFGSLTGWYRQTPDFADADFVAGAVGIPGPRRPEWSHGTECAGMIGAIGDNGRGGCGVAWEADVSMIACLGDQVGTQSTLARAIAYAADPREEGADGEQGADVISCSLGPSSSAAWTLSETLRLAIEFLRSARGGRGVPLFWACTNGPHPIAADEVCSHVDVIAVGRSTEDDGDDASGFGPKLEFLAPGVDVFIPTVGGGYAPTTGTSFAAPCAAAIATLILAKNPSRTAAEVRRIMRDTCDKVGPLPYNGGRNDRFGHGRVNAKRAVAAA